MRRFVWHWVVISSLLAASLPASVETRPQYGGTLHVAMRAAPTSLDPTDATVPDSFSRRNLVLLMFDTLVAARDAGPPQPALAVSWERSSNDQHWEFRLRRGVTFEDGTAFSADTTAASLQAANPTWKVSARSDVVIIECDNPTPALLAELALPRNAIVKKGADGAPVGTGPFRVTDWQPGKKLTLAANENYWRGRPFLDSIEVEMGKSYRDQVSQLEVGRTELIEVAPEQTHRFSLQGRSIWISPPMELVALVFAREASTPEEKLLRDTLALSIDRTSIRSVLLQGAGQPTGSILPSWLTGYGFVFPTETDLPRARRERSQVKASPNWTLGYDTADSISQLLAERIALNAKDAGLSLRPTANGASDVRVVRIPFSTTDPWVALDQAAMTIGLPFPHNEAGSMEDLYAAEKAMLASQQLLPLFHLPISYAAAPSVKGWQSRTDGTWQLDNLWLGPPRP